ncbi:sphingomyelin phosphodiesterase [Anaeramoeba flamelloides]|uniref:Sphingomyelin phosphodiesterase n=1 Tax=Anaeramoeba flamelloides TaxID=1746091 RepID=A0ABQ8XN64_9EUKA|nr:sphingomyelin phosphodiesterase [Anaeramoeba flamelloides]
MSLSIQNDKQEQLFEEQYTPTNKKKSKFNTLNILSGAFVVLFLTCLILIFVHIITDLVSNSEDQSKTIDLQDSFLIINDIHLNLQYDPAYSSSTDCIKLGDPAYNTSQDCGYYGRYGCDPPIQTLKAVLKGMKKYGSQSKFLLVLGDFSSHWAGTKENVDKDIQTVCSTIVEEFPNLPVFPVIGNAEGYPDYNMSFVNNNPRLVELAQFWSKWLKEGSDQRTTFEKGGYYMVDLKTIEDNLNFNLIVLNTVYYSTFHTPTTLPDGTVPEDPGDQLQWLETQLKNLKKSKKKTLIVYHIPPGGNGYDNSLNWNSQYEKKYIELITKYSEEILGMMSGHYHTDDFMLVNDENGKLVSSNFISPSITLNHDTNPSFRKIYFDRSTKKIVDYDQYFFDLRLANRHAQTSNGEDSDIKWNLGYSFKDAYHVDDATPTSLQTVIQNMENDPVESTLWHARKHVFYWDEKPGYLCSMQYTLNDDFQKCVNNSYINQS